MARLLQFQARRSNKELRMELQKKMREAIKEEEEEDDVFKDDEN